MSQHTHTHAHTRIQMHCESKLSPLLGSVNAINVSRASEPETFLFILFFLSGAGFFLIYSFYDGAAGKKFVSMFLILQRLGFMATHCFCTWESHDLNNLFFHVAHFERFNCLGEIFKINKHSSLASVSNVVWIVWLFFLLFFQVEKNVHFHRSSKICFDPVT